jgi:diguanylate cyclase (GGDEF)-like protein
LCESGEQEPIDLLACETERLLEPTQELSVRLAQAYEMIRLQANQLTSVSDVRTDAMTGLGNRLALEEMLANQIEMRRRYGMICSVAMFDIDLLKRVNTTQGKLRGDEVLKQVGQLLDQYTRESDLICRYGGEEFVVVLPGTNLDGAVAFAERLRISVERFSPVTVSCGVSEVTVEDDLKGIMSRADAALYSAKKSGRNRVFQHTGRSVCCATPPQRSAIEQFNLERQDQAAHETIRAVSQTLRTSMRMDAAGKEVLAGSASGAARDLGAPLLG